ncbi:MAG: hypothetical protein HY907_03650 [Deltaproteobacteria bacterium]|nr:hypothetical protein [Deltaproteobacteria bacterium]
MGELGDDEAGLAPEAPGDGLSPEEQAALPPDTPVRRLLDDRRVRIAAIAGIPLVVALLTAAAIFAHGFGVARSVRVEGPTLLAPGLPTSLRVGYAEMDDFGLPHPVRIEHVRLEVCPDSSSPDGRPPDSCLLLGEGGNAPRPGDIALNVEVPEVPAGTHTVRLELRAGGKSASFAFRVPFRRDGGAPAERRENGRAAAFPLGDSGVVVDLVPFDGGIVRGWTSALLARARGADGRPWRGALYLLWLGDEPPEPVPSGADAGEACLLGGGCGPASSGVPPPRVETDAAGLAGFALRSETFEYRLAISTVPYPAMDPLEVSVGLLPEEVLATAALFEVPFRPVVGPLRVASSPLETRDRPFLRRGDPLVLTLARPSPHPTPLWAEVYRGGNLLRLAIGESPGAPLEFTAFSLPDGLVFAQLHRPGETKDSVVGRHVWVGREAPAEGELAPSPAETEALLGAVEWRGDERAWVEAVRAVVASLAPTERERLGRYALGRNDSIWYAQGTLFDSHPGDAARVEELRESVKSTMAWGIGAFAVALAGLAAYVVTVSLRDARRRRAVAVAAAAGAPAGESRERGSIYDRVGRPDASGLWRIAVMCLIVALALAGIAVLVWGMKQTYLAP